VSIQLPVSIYLIPYLSAIGRTCGIIQSTHSRSAGLSSPHRVYIYNTIPPRLSAVHPADLQAPQITQPAQSQPTQSEAFSPRMSDNQAPASVAPLKVSNPVHKPPNANPPRKARSLSYAQQLYASAGKSPETPPPVPPIPQEFLERGVSGITLHDSTPAGTALPTSATSVIESSVQPPPIIDDSPSSPIVAQQESKILPILPDPPITNSPPKFPDGQIPNASEFYNERLVLQTPQQNTQVRHVVRSSSEYAPSTQQPNVGMQPQNQKFTPSSVSVDATRPSQSYDQPALPQEVAQPDPTIPGPSVIQSDRSIPGQVSQQMPYNQPYPSVSTTAYPSPPQTSSPMQMEGTSFPFSAPAQSPPFSSPTTYQSSLTSYSPTPTTLSSAPTNYSSPATTFSPAPTSPTTYPSPPASYPSPLATYPSPPATYPSPPATYPSPPATYPSPPTTYFSQPAPYMTPPTSYSVPAAYPSQPQVNYSQPAATTNKSGAPLTHNQVSANVMLDVGKSVAGLLGKSLASAATSKDGNIVGNVTNLAMGVNTGAHQPTHASTLPNMTGAFNGMPNLGNGLQPQFDLNSQYQNLMGQYQTLQMQPPSQHNTQHMHGIMYQMQHVQSQMAAHQHAHQFQQQQQVYHQPQQAVPVHQGPVAYHKSGTAVVPPSQAEIQAAVGKAAKYVKAAGRVAKFATTLR
jgi:hypothetical protein